jgi:hypothetical protein
MAVELWRYARAEGTLPPLGVPPDGEQCGGVRVRLDRLLQAPAPSQAHSTEPRTLTFESRRTR